MSRAPGNDLRPAADVAQGDGAAARLPPSRADVASLAREGVRLQGQAPVSGLARLAEELSPDTGRDGTSVMVAWTMALSLRAKEGRAAEPWLHLGACACLPLTCQRCLCTVPTAVDIERDFRFVADEETAEREDEESEEDVLALDRQFDLHALLEDELLMALPLVPRHETCPNALPVRDSGAPTDPPLSGKPNPFAVLGRLKVPPTGSGRG